MNIVFFQDPIVELIDTPLEERKQRVIAEIGILALGRYAKANNNSLQITYIYPKGYFTDRIIKELPALNIELKEIDLDEIKNFCINNGIDILDIAGEKINDLFYNFYKETLLNLIGEEVDFIIGWESAPKYLSTMFDAIVLEGHHSSFYRAIRDVDILFNVFYKGKQIKQIQNQNIENLDSVKEIISKYLQLSNLSLNRSEFDPNGLFKKYVFFPGHHYTFRLKQYLNNKTEEEILYELADKLPDDYGIIYVPHPLNVHMKIKASFYHKKVLNLEEFAKNDQNLSLKILPYCEIMFNISSNIGVIASLFDIPVVQIGECEHINDFVDLHINELKNMQISKVDKKLKVQTYINQILQRSFFNTPNAYYNYLVALKESITKYNSLLYLNNIESYASYLKTILLLKDTNSNFATQGPNQYNSIIGEILNPNIKHIGFDIFDTLLLRPFYTPTDLFDYVDVFVDKITKLNAFNFKVVRINAENMARLKAKKKNICEVTLDEIYNEFKLITNFDEKTIEEIKQLEINTETNMLYPRMSVKNLFEIAKANSKNIFIASDMYLPTEVIENILSKNNYSGYKLYLSSEEKLAKYNSSLFYKIKQDLKSDGSDILFLGDNIKSDVNIPTSLNIKAYQIPKATERFNQTKYLKLSDGGFLNAGNFNRHHLAIIANTLFDNPFIEFDNNTYTNNSSGMLGFAITGPLLTSLTVWLTNNVENKYDKLLFCARDGFLVQKAYDYIAKYKILPKSEYFYISRSATLPLYLNKPYISLLPNLYVSEKSTKEFLIDICQISFDKKIKKLIKKHNLDLSIKASLQTAQIIEFLTEIEFDNTEEIDELVNYTNNIVENTKIAFFDLGTRATSQRILFDYLKNISKVYLFRETIYKHNTNFIDSYYIESINSFRLGIYKLFPNLYEALMSNIHDDTCVGYSNNKPILGNTPHSANKNLIIKQQLFALEFHKVFIDTFKDFIDIINCGPEDRFLFPFAKLSAGQSDLEVLNKLSTQDPLYSNKNTLLYRPMYETKPVNNPKSVNVAKPAKKAPQAPSIPFAKPVNNDSEFDKNAARKLRKFAQNYPKTNAILSPFIKGWRKIYRAAKGKK